MSSAAKSVYSQLEDIVGCKWSVSVLRAIADGVTRPGALEPLRTEYSLTSNGQKLVAIIDQLKLLDGEIRSAEQRVSADANK